MAGEKADCEYSRPPALPQQAIYLLNYYRSSTFNTCQHQPLPLMHGEPLKFHVQEDAVPTAIHVLPSIPVHWRNRVMKGIEQDVALGVLEKVPPNTPSTWCHRLVIIRKRNGDPRRNVDLKKLNDVCVRQTHPTEPPFKQAMDVPHESRSPHVTPGTVTTRWQSERRIDT